MGLFRCSILANVFTFSELFHPFINKLSRIDQQIETTSICANAVEPQHMVALALPGRFFAKHFLSLSTLSASSLLLLVYVLRARLRRLKEMFASRSLCFLFVLFKWIKGFTFLNATSFFPYKAQEISGTDFHVI